MEARDLTTNERGILDFLLTRSFRGRDALVEQAKTVRTTGLSCSCGCPSFGLAADRSLPAAVCTDRMPSDAHGTDPGGNPIGVLLFVDTGYLAEVEIFSEDDSPFAGLPSIEALTLSEWSETDELGIRWLLNP